MKRTLPFVVRPMSVWCALILAAFTITSSAHAQEKDVTGNWQGTLQSGNDLRIVMKITKDDGKLKGVFYSIDQGSQPIRITSITVEDKSFNFSIKASDVTYVGTLSPDGSTITGNQTQNSRTSVLNFQHVTPEATWAIPESPKAMAADAIPRFEVVTIKPSVPDRPGKLVAIRGTHVMIINTNMYDLLGYGYNLHSKQIIGGPAWFGTDRFDIDGIPDTPGRPNVEQIKLLIQSVLVDRFQLTFHHDQKELAIYAITVAKGGPKLTETIHKSTDLMNHHYRKLGQLVVSNATIRDFCEGMQGSALDKPVVDHTGLTAHYDFTLDWTPDDSQFLQMGGYHPPATEDPNAPPALNTAMQNQLGIKIDSIKAPIDVIVIDKVEKPSAN